MSTVARVTRTIDATPEEVFAAWTEPDQLRQWLCPAPGHVVEASCAPVVGGSYRLLMRFPDHAAEITGDYLVVDPPHRLVFTWRHGQPAHDTLVTVTLEPAGEATDMTIIHERTRDTRHRQAVTTGWTSVTVRLQLHLTPG